MLVNVSLLGFPLIKLEYMSCSPPDNCGIVPYPVSSRKMEILLKKKDHSFRFLLIEGNKLMIVLKQVSPEPWVF